MTTSNFQKADTSQKLDINKSVYKYFFNLDFVLSIIVPIIAFYIFNSYNAPLAGTICIGIWCISIIIIQFIRTRNINIYAAISGMFSLISLICTLISRNPMYYMASPIVQDIIFALILFISVLIKRPIIKSIAEYSMKTKFPQKSNKESILKSPWSIVTLLWGLSYIIKAVLRIVLLYFSSYSTYYAITSVYSSVSDILLLIFSLWFVKWWYKKTKHETQ